MMEERSGSQGGINTKKGINKENGRKTFWENAKTRKKEERKKVK